jgi:hypothetical protein
VSTTRYATRLSPIQLTRIVYRKEKRNDSTRMKINIEVY